MIKIVSKEGNIVDVILGLLMGVVSFSIWKSIMSYDFSLLATQVEALILLVVIFIAYRFATKKIVYIKNTA